MSVWQRGAVVRRLLSLCAIAVACAESPGRDAPDAEPLGAAVDSIATGFTMPRWLSESEDGSLVLFDRAEERLYRVAHGRGEAELLGTRGRGPMEYRVVHGIVRGPGDSLVVMDMDGPKAIVLDAEARPARQQRSPLRPSSGAAIGDGWIRAISSAGDWYSSDRAMTFSPRFYADDSASVVIWRAADGRTDTLARVAARRESFTPPSAPMRIDVFDAVDAWGVFRDGRVIVVRGRDYGIELIDPDGRVTRAGHGPTPLLPLTREDAELTRDSLGRQFAAVLRMMPMGGQSSARPEPALPEPLPVQWPLLRGTEVLVDWQNRAWVRVRTAPRDTGATSFDLFDREGQFIKSVSVPAGGIVIGFGRSAVFVAWRDEDDLIWVKRHPLP
jgi:hypothetical protein